MITNLILVIHIVVCVALILIILLQSGKGADIGAVFGGGASQTLFGSSGATPFLSKVTIGAAVVFMVTSIFLTYFSGKGISVEKSLVTGTPMTEAPLTQGQPAPATTEGGATKSAPAKEGSAPSPAGAESKAAPAGTPSPATPSGSTTQGSGGAEKPAAGQ